MYHEVRSTCTSKMGVRRHTCGSILLYFSDFLAQYLASIVCVDSSHSSQTFCCILRGLVSHTGRICAASSLQTPIVELCHPLNSSTKPSMRTVYFVGCYSCQPHAHTSFRWFMCVHAVKYNELLTILWDRIDPTTLNRQGNDRGTQYRSG